MQFWDPEDELVNSIVGSGTQFRGNIVLSGIFRIDGDFVGTIRNEGKIIIGRNARSEGIIEAASVVIGGVFRGDIWTSWKVLLLSSAIVCGTISTPHLVVERGCLLDASISVEPIKNVLAHRDKENLFSNTTETKYSSHISNKKQIRTL